MTTKKKPLMDKPEMWSDFNRIWREVTKGMTKKERKEFVQWHDEILKGEK